MSSALVKPCRNGWARTGFRRARNAVSFNADWLPEDASRSAPACPGCAAATARTDGAALAYAAVIARPAAE